jgi:activating signal cointegrator complex subunit 1
VNDITRPQLEASLDQFRGVISAENEDVDSESEIPLKAIRPVGTIHFTLGVMSLTSIDRVSEAIGFLQTLDLNNLMGQVLREQQNTRNVDVWPLQVSLTSLHSMHTPRNTSILYAGPEDSRGVLHALCVKLRDAFSAAGFLVPDDRPLKLHATILNTIYAKAGGKKQHIDNTLASNSAIPGSSLTPGAKNVGAGDQTSTSTETRPDRSRGHGPNAKAPIRIDATSLLQRCKDMVWAADVRIEKIAICKMGAQKITDEQGNVVDECYEEVASVELP